MDTLETFEHAGRTIRIYLDPDPQSPREWDNLATFYCWHRRYNLGDVNGAGKSADELTAKVKEDGDRIVAILPLYLYEHSGMTIRTGAFSDPWDSGQVGWAYVTESQARKMGCVTKSRRMLSRAKLEGYIRQEVSTFDKFLTGQVYEFEVESACEPEGTGVLATLTDTEGTGAP